MTMSIAVLNVCFVACHAAPVEPFAVFADDLQKKGCNVEIFATGPALEKFQAKEFKQIKPFSLEGRVANEVASEIARKCNDATLVITDVGHPFNITLQEALAKEAPKVTRAAFYDNPEDFVTGGYSATAAKVMQAANLVFFANANLSEAPIYEEPSKSIPIAQEKKVGLGYYPLKQVVEIAQLRKEKGAHMRSQFFETHGLVDRGQKLLVYAGGNNEEYFSKAWPAFLRILKEANLTDAVVVLQQHPGAKKENRDGKELEKWDLPYLVISKMQSSESQVAADAMLYYQTSMAPQFVLEEIPTIQVGHAVYPDILTKNGLCQIATNTEGFLLALKGIDATLPIDQELVKKNLGIRSDWADRLADCIQKIALNRMSVQSRRTSCVLGLLALFSSRMPYFQVNRPI